MKKNTNEELQTIAILGGTGKEGPGLALRWASVGYPVIIGSREREKAQRVAAELNKELEINSIEGLENQDAAKKADICVLTVLASAHQPAIESLKGVLAGKILVDATARVDFRDPKPPDPPSAPRIAQTILGSEARVVSALQSIPAHALRQNLGGDLDMDVLVCSDDPDAADEVIGLLNAAGMRGFNAGNLDNAIVSEGLTAVLIQINKNYGVKKASISVRGIEV